MTTKTTEQTNYESFCYYLGYILGLEVETPAYTVENDNKLKASYGQYLETFQEWQDHQNELQARKDLIRSKVDELAKRFLKLRKDNKNSPEEVKNRIEQENAEIIKLYFTMWKAQNMLLDNYEEDEELAGFNAYLIAKEIK
jgi:hypothetical protein